MEVRNRVPSKDVTVSVVTSFNFIKRERLETNGLVQRRTRRNQYKSDLGYQESQNLVRTTEEKEREEKEKRKGRKEKGGGEVRKKKERV